MTFKKIYLIAIISVTLAVLGAVYLLYTQGVGLSEVQHQADEAENHRIAKKKEIDTIRDRLENFDREKKELSRYLFEERDIPAFLDQISQYAKQTEVGIVNMQTRSFQQVQVSDEFKKQKYGEVKQAEPISKETLDRVLTLSAMPIDIQLKGTYENVVKFLDHLQDYTQLISVSRLEMRRAGDYPILSSSFTLRIYSLKALSELK